MVFVVLSILFMFMWIINFGVAFLPKADFTYTDRSSAVTKRSSLLPVYPEGLFSGSLFADYKHYF